MVKSRNGKKYRKEERTKQKRRVEARKIEKYIY
jgi:hypothetical protein